MTFNIDKLIEKRNKLIEKYPQLKKTQEEYDRIMAATREEDKISVAFIMLGAKLEELNEAINKLKQSREGDTSNG